MIWKSLKNNQKVVKFYQWLIGYKAGNKHWCRVVMDQQTEALIKQLPCGNMTVLEISGDKWKDFGFLNYRSVSYPDYDICSGVLPEKFDLIICEQVFEHLLWPNRAARNVFDMLHEGGYFLITTPFMIRIHDFPVDCTRWSPTGLKYMLAECGFPLDKILTDCWGNEACVIANFYDWMPYNPSRHSLKNEPDFPVVVWGLAKK